jgi:hypothetical protein
MDLYVARTADGAVMYVVVDRDDPGPVAAAEADPDTGPEPGPEIEP